MPDETIYKNPPKENRTDRREETESKQNGGQSRCQLKEGTFSQWSVSLLPKSLEERLSKRKDNAEIIDLYFRGLLDLVQIYAEL